MVRTYNKWVGNQRGIPEDKSRCIESVYESRGFHSNQCSRKRGYGKDGLYCKQHDPVRIEARVKKSQERFDADMAKRRRPFEQLAKYRKALQEIASGKMNDPVWYAENILKDAE